MAEDKKSFLMYCDLIHTILKMPDDKAGLLFKHILKYVNDLNPITDDLIVELTFEPIRQQLKRDLDKYNDVKIDKSNSGKIGNLKRWNKDLYDKVVSNELVIDEAMIIARGRKASHSDNVPSQTVANIAVNDNVNVTVTDIKELKEELIDFKKLLIYVNTSFGQKFKMVSDAVKRKLNARIKEGYTASDIKDCIDGLKKDEWHKSIGYKPVTLEYISRSATIDKYSTKSTIQPTEEDGNDDYYRNVMAQVNKYKEQ